MAVPTCLAASGASRSIVLLCAALTACTPAPPALQKHRLHAGRQARTHPNHSQPLLERVTTIPPVVLDYLIEDSSLNRWPTTARAHSVTPQERAIIAKTFASLPPAVLAMATKHIAGIYFVEDLGSSGWSEFLDPPSRQTFMVFDAVVLRDSANKWATRKECSAFAAEDISLELTAAGEDEPGGAFRFIFLHELGHAVAHARRLVPSWIDRTGGEYAFASLVAGSKPFRPTVRFYAPSKQRIAAAQTNDIYAAWASSEYPTLYATVSAEEDFAESFASYVHIQMLRQPYRIRIGAEIYENGISQSRCALRREFVAELFRRDEPW